MGHWRKLGRIFEPQALHPKLASHAANPLALPLGGDLFRIYYSGRDGQNRSSVGYVDFDLARREILYIHDRPAVEHGPDGSFFSHGISIGNCYEAGGKRYILFMGWQVPADGHWRGDIGRLAVEPDGTLAVDGKGPFLGASDVDPLSLSYPWVTPVEGGFKMWYGSTISWDAGNGEMLHVINQAVSSDGLQWDPRGLAVPFALGKAQAFSRPTVLRDDAGHYRMWFSFRGAPGRAYRIGYAESDDGEAWRLRLDRAGMDVSPDGWDSEMVEYPFAFRHEGQDFLLYNGNGHGRTGFGLAVWEG